MKKNHIINRLKRAEGQVRGIQKMVIEKRSCNEILQQITAIESAVNNVAIILLENHTKHCIENAVPNAGENRDIQVLIKTINNFVKK